MNKIIPFIIMVAIAIFQQIVIKKILQMMVEEKELYLVKLEEKQRIITYMNDKIAILKNGINTMFCSKPYNNSVVDNDIVKFAMKCSHPDDLHHANKEIYDKCVRLYQENKGR